MDTPERKRRTEAIEGQHAEMDSDSDEDLDTDGTDGTVMYTATILGVGVNSCWHVKTTLEQINLRQAMC